MPIKLAEKVIIRSPLYKQCSITSLKRGLQPDLNKNCELLTKWLKIITASRQENIITNRVKTGIPDKSNGQTDEDKRSNPNSQKGLNIYYQIKR